MLHAAQSLQGCIASCFSLPVRLASYPPFIPSAIMGCCNLFRFSRRKDREKPGTPALQVAVATSDDFQEKRSEEGPKTSSTTDLQSTSTSTPELVAESLPGRLWNLAYDQLKSKDPKLIEHYESILSSQIDGQELKAVNLDTHINKISLGQPRSLQMRQLVDSGLLRTEKAAATNEALAQGLQVFNVVKDSVATATRASPEASIAWVPICLALDVWLANFDDASTWLMHVRYL